MKLKGSKIRGFVVLCLWAGSLMELGAGVQVTENIDKANEEKWVKKPDLMVVEVPKMAGAPQAVNSKTRVSQSFTTTRNLTLDKIIIKYSAEETAGTFAIRIQEVPEGYESLTYAEGPDLFPEPLTFACTVSTNKESKLLEFKFDGNSKINLPSRKTYVLEIIGLQGKGLSWMRRAADEYPKGRAYIDRSQLSGNDDARDLCLAIYGD